jgi:hypothetical protein
MFQTLIKASAPGAIPLRLATWTGAGPTPDDLLVAPPCGLHHTVAKRLAEWRQWRRESLEYQFMAHGRKIAVIGLGYVGLPVAVSFARSGVPVVGFDLDARRVAELKEGIDRTREVEGADLHQASLVLSAKNPAAMRESDFYIVTVPTPIDEVRQPDLSADDRSIPLCRCRAQDGRHRRLRVDRLSRRRRRRLCTDP